MRIGERVFVETGFRENNVGLIKLKEGAILVDMPPSPEEVEIWFQALEELSPGPFLYLVVTDCHPFRLLGLTKAQIPRVAHYNLREELLGARSYFKLIFRECYQKYYDGEPPESFDIFLPTLAFKGIATFHRGKDTVKLISSEGPTPASIAVYLPQDRILFAGALVVRGAHPDLRLALSAKWIKNLKRLKSLPIEVVIPVRGEPCGPEIFDEMIDYLTRVRKAVEEFYQAGKGRPDVSRLVSNLLPLLPYPPDQEEEVRNLLRAGLARLYDEIKAGELKASPSTLYSKGIE